MDRGQVRNYVGAARATGATRAAVAGVCALRVAMRGGAAFAPCSRRVCFSLSLRGDQLPALSAAVLPQKLDKPVAVDGDALSLALQADAGHAPGCARVEGVRFGLGVSALQLNGAAREFAYAQDAPLDMRSDQTAHTAAAEMRATCREGIDYRAPVRWIAWRMPSNVRCTTVWSCTVSMRFGATWGSRGCAPTSTNKGG